MPGEDVAVEVVSKSFDSMGAAAGMFLILLAVIIGGVYLASLWLKMQSAKKVKKDTPKPAEPRITETMMGRLMGMTAGDVHAARSDKSRTDESQDDRMTILEERVNSLFTVEGNHRQELIAAIDKVDAKVGKLRDKSDDKNSEQDRLIRGLSDSIHTLQGMVAGKRGGSGATLFVKPEDKN